MPRNLSRIATVAEATGKKLQQLPLLRITPVAASALQTILLQQLTHSPEALLAVGTAIALPSFKPAMVVNVDKGNVAMSHRETKILWLKDMLEQLHKSQQQLAWTNHPDTIRVITESMVRDLDSCRRICEEMNRRVTSRQAV